MEFTFGSIWFSAHVPMPWGGWCLLQPAKRIPHDEEAFCELVRYGFDGGILLDGSDSTPVDEIVLHHWMKQGSSGVLGPIDRKSESSSATRGGESCKTPVW